MNIPFFFFLFLNVHHENYSYPHLNRSLASICMGACSLVPNDLDCMLIYCVGRVHGSTLSVGVCLGYRASCTRCAYGQLARHTGSEVINIFSSSGLSGKGRLLICHSQKYRPMCDLICNI